jgi:hypothetical protein
MSNVALGSQHLLGAGKVWVAMYVNGVLQVAERFLGNNDKFDVTPEVQRVEIRDSTSVDNALLDSGETQRTLKLSINMREYSKENLAMQQMGTVTTYAQTNTPVVDEPVVVVAQDRSFQLGGYVNPARNVSAPVVKHTSGSPTYVNGTDYIHNLKQGTIYIPAGSVIAAGATVKVSYTPATETRNLVNIGQANDVDALVRFESNARRGPKIDALIWHVQFSGASAMALVGPTEYAALALEGNILSDESNHPTAKYGVLITP